MKKVFFFLVFLFLADILSKMAAIEWIPSMTSFNRAYPFGGIPIFNFWGISFSLNYIVNTGAAWGFFTGYPGLLFGIRTLIILGLASYLLFFQKGDGLPKFPTWLIVTGAVGNAVDYLLYGHVIDFLHFAVWNRSFPIFNLADSYITLGVVGLIFARSAQKHVHVL